MNEGFYMVWVEGKPAPAKKYSDYGLAKHDAEVLARKEKSKAYVLSAQVEFAPVVNISATLLKPLEEISILDMII